MTDRIARAGAPGAEARPGTDQVEDAATRVDRHFRLYHRRGLEEYEISDTPGFWTRKEPCAGRGACSAPIHGFFGCEGPIRHTAQYLDPTRDRASGRITSPCRTWRELRAAQSAGSVG